MTFSQNQLVNHDETFIFGRIVQNETCRMLGTRNSDMFQPRLFIEPWKCKSDDGLGSLAKEFEFLVYDIDGGIKNMTDFIELMRFTAEKGYDDLTVARGVMNIFGFVSFMFAIGTLLSGCLSLTRF